MKLSHYLTFTLISLSAAAYAGMEGERELFKMEKNHNPQNKMIIHTQTDNDCRFTTSPKNKEKNYVEFYWVMNHGQSIKEVHPMIRSEIKNRVKFSGINAGRDSFKIKLNDLTEVRHDLPDASLEVVSEVADGKCKVKSILTLGPSEDYRKIDLSRTFCNVSKNMLGVPNGCLYIEVEGKDISSGEKVVVKFKKK